jgi:outer membrane protein assembly factor BamB
MKTPVFSLLLLALFYSCNNSKVQKTCSSNEIPPFTAQIQHSIYVEYDNINDPQKMHVILDQERMLVNKSGQIFSPDGSLLIDLGLGADIQVIYLWKDGSELTIVAELSDGDNGWTVIEKMNLMQKHKVWSTKFGGFNAGVPVIVNGKIYVSTIGALAKIDQSNGSFCWKIENLYDGSKYNGFEEPVFVNSEQVLFRSDKPFVDKMDEVLVDDVKGTILRKD